MRLPVLRAVTVAWLGVTLLGSPLSRATEPAPALSRFGWLADLAGACWKGTHPDGKTSDTQCYEVRFGRLLRGTIAISREGVPAFEGEGIFAVDPAGGNRVVFAQWGSGGIYSTGEVTFEGDTLVFRNRLPDGTLAPLRSVWRRTAPDSFHVTRERETPGKGWSGMLEVEYRRAP